MYASPDMLIQAIFSADNASCKAIFAHAGGQGVNWDLASPIKVIEVSAACQSGNQPEKEA